MCTGLCWECPKQPFLLSSCSSQSMGTPSNSLEPAHTSFMASFLELVPTSFPDFSLNLPQCSCLLPVTQWLRMAHGPESQLDAIVFEHLPKSMYLFASLVPRYQKQVEFCPHIRTWCSSFPTGYHPPLLPMALLPLNSSTSPEYPLPSPAPLTIPTMNYVPVRQTAQSRGMGPAWSSKERIQGELLSVGEEIATTSTHPVVILLGQ